VGGVDAVGTGPTQEALAVEFLVTMTTQVPDGTSQDAVDEVRGREAARSAELVAEGHLLRLWRPPLRPGEWRTLGLFAAGDEVQLEDVLASMPLRVWRSDQVVALSAHPNDPAPAGGAPVPRRTRGQEFLTTFEVTFPDGAGAAEIDEVQAAEAARTRELAGRGNLVRLWMLAPEPGRWRALGLWRAVDGEQLRAILGSLPMDKWMTTQITPLTEHPSDPG
jgi:muconolactone delta-isomerase